MQDKVNKLRTNSIIRKQMVSPLSFATITVIVLVVWWMCTYSEAWWMHHSFDQNSLTVFGRNKLTVTSKLLCQAFVLPSPLSPSSCPVWASSNPLWMSVQLPAIYGEFSLFFLHHIRRPLHISHWKVSRWLWSIFFIYCSQLARSHEIVWVKQEQTHHNKPFLSA